MKKVKLSSNKFSELVAKMPPESQKRIATKSAKLMTKEIKTCLKYMLVDLGKLERLLSKC